MATAYPTPTSEQYNCTNLVDRAVGYGIEGRQVNGNNILEVYHAISEITSAIRQKPRPVLLECITFRMRGHEEASGTKYVPQYLIDEWLKRDPISNYEDYLLGQNILQLKDITQIKTRFKQVIDTEIEKAFNDDDIVPEVATELQDMYHPHPAEAIQPANNNKTNKRYIDAISDTLMLGMRKFDNLVMMGQDIAEYGGVFKITAGLAEEFGKARVRNTPICESAIVGAALGLSINGYKAIVEMQFADFVTCGFNQIVNNLAKSYYRWQEKADVVIRMPAGAGTGAGPFHSQSNEAWFTKTPGLKVVYPASPADAKGLLLAAIEDPNPVIYFEHKYLYRTISEEIPDDYYTIPIGKAKIVREGETISLITYGLGVHWAMAYAEKHPEVSVEIIDLRSLQPWDKEAVETSVKKTGRAIILHEDTLTSGFGAEIAAHLAEHCFSYLDAPILRCASLDTAIPMNKDLEEQFLANARLEETMERLLQY